MPSKSTGRITKSRKGARSTPHQKNHRWESFSIKISKLHTLDPLRKVRRHDLAAESLSTDTSYFQQSLQKWVELNISKGFVSFKRAVLPLCDSLPQLLHHEQDVMDLLEEHISKREKESLEPLLDLLTAFSHDLGSRFDKFYGRSLHLIVGIASTPQEVEVIEWAFGSLAFLFKYLSRLLVPDLRPTYDVLVPLLGKSRHPPHIARFAAEALSFLIKKAASPSTRDTALPKIIEHVRDDLLGSVGDRQSSLYQDGVMTMFAEAMKGTSDTVHSSGPQLFCALLDAIPENESRICQFAPWTSVVCGVLTSTLHKCSAAAVDDLISSVGDYIKAKVDSQSLERLQWDFLPWFQVLGTLAGVRGGSKVSTWAPLVGVLTKMTELLSEAKVAVVDDSGILWNRVIVNIGLVWQRAPMDTLIAHLSSLVQAMTTQPLMTWFVPFCVNFAEMETQRFASLFRNDFQKFILKHWSEGGNENLLCVLLPRMASQLTGDKLRLPQTWQDQIVSKFERLEASPFPEGGAYDKDPQTWRDYCLPKYLSLLGLLEATASHPSVSLRISELLLRKLKLALRPSSTLASDEVHFIIGPGFKAYLRMAQESQQVDSSLQPLLCAAIPRFCRSETFLDTLAQYEAIVTRSAGAKQDKTPEAEDMGPALSSLMANLASPSHSLRLLSLKMLQHWDNGVEEACLLTMTEIEETPMSLASVRALGMHMRKLVQSYLSLPAGSWLLPAVPSFLFGMLTVKMSPVWDDAAESLKTIVSQSKDGEEQVSQLAFQWLDVGSSRWKPPVPAPVGGPQGPLTDFDCSYLLRLIQPANRLHEVIENPERHMRLDFDRQQETAAPLIPDARSRALKVIGQVPALAERRSRKLIPLFLSWAGSNAEHQDTLEADEPGGASSHWSLSDRKALLGVLANFGNPKVLYRHDEVYQALLGLVGNGDIEVQRLALKAVLTWKQEGVRHYQERLENILNESKFKNEVTLLFQNDDAIKPEHRHDLMPVLLRILYGRTISKKGAASGRQGLQATRLFVLRNLDAESTRQFIDIGLGKLGSIQILRMLRDASEFRQPLVPLRNQLGTLNMILSLVSELGKSTSDFVDPLVNAVLYCSIFAQRQCSRGTDTGGVAVEGQAELGSSLLKDIRSTGLKCLASLCHNAPSFDWTPYKDTIVERLIRPRLERLSVETSQAVSGILKLLHAWSSLPRCAIFLCGDGNQQDILPFLVECLAFEKGKDEVKIFVLQIIRNLVKLASDPTLYSEFSELIKVELIESNSDQILRNLTAVLESATVGHSLLDECIETIIDVSSLISHGSKGGAVLKACSYLLEQPPRRVNPRTKGRVLVVVKRFVSLHKEVQLDAADDSTPDVFGNLASLFGYFKDRENRETLAEIFRLLTEDDAAELQIAMLVSDLNSFAPGQIDVPDYDKRLQAFQLISRGKEVPWTPRQWLPVLHNLLFFIKMDEEFGILASNSADALCRFVEESHAGVGPDEEAFASQMKDVLLPAIYSGAREPSDTVRREVLRVFGRMLQTWPTWEPIADLSGVFGTSEEEGSEPFFLFNILSPAVSRQLEALKFLEAAVGRSEIKSQNLSQFFVPLLEHFVFGRAEGVDDHGLGARASDVIGVMSSSLEWKHFRTIFTRYISYINSKPEALKRVNRLLGRMADSLLQASETASGSAAPTAQRSLTRSLPSRERLNSEIVDGFVPPLLKHLHEKDESEVSYRVPVGVAVVKLLKVLPPEQMSQILAGALTDICHILRSKSWESRELSRDTLVNISSVLGASYFGFILKELRGALTRGYQLHVLSYTLHSMLVAAIPAFEPGQLDYCLPSICTVIMDDIFGVTGQEKEAEGYTTQMKEIKSSKSHDSMELAAKNASIGHLRELIQPIHALLLQKIDLRTVRQIDSLLARVTAGLLRNPASESRDTLVFCYEIFQGFFNGEAEKPEQKMDPKTRKYLMRRGVSTAQGAKTRYSFKLVRFALDILRAVFKKYDSLRNSANIAGFTPILGDFLVSSHEEVKTAVFRLLPVLVKVPFGGNEEADLFKLAARDAVKSISSAISTSTDLSQSALKLLSVVLRERKEIPVKDAAVDLLLGRLKDDLTQPLFRHVTFNFLRSVLERKIETATVYDTMDYTGTVMVTNDDKDTRDLARGAYFQFLREYPQKRSRWEKQLRFIVANLKYDREGGRISIMEVIHLLLTKSPDQFVQEIAATCFIPLTLVLANDESDKCRMAAAELVGQIFRRADPERTDKIIELPRSWLDKSDNTAVVNLALRAFGFYFSAQERSESDVKSFRLVLKRIREIIAPEDVTETEGDLVIAALDAVESLTERFPSSVLSAKWDEDWMNVSGCMKHPDTSVRLATVKLLSQYLAHFAKDASASSSGMLSSSFGSVLDNEKIEAFVQLSLSVLDQPEVESAIASEASKILIFLVPRVQDGGDGATFSEDSDSGEDEDGEHSPEGKRHPLGRITRKICSVLRKETPPKADSIRGKSAVMEVLEVVCRKVPAGRLRPSLRTILGPLHNLTDKSIVAPHSLDESFKAQYEELKTKAELLMESLQKKFGVAEYTQELLAVRDAVKVKREQRTSKRKIDAVVHPERYGASKRKKLEKNKERRKLRGREQKAARQAYKGW